MPSSQKNMPIGTVCQILRLNKIVDHNWNFIQWYVVREEACFPAPRTTKLEHCTSYLNYSFTIKYLTIRRATARRHGALPRPAVPKKTKIIYQTWIFIHQYVLYYKWRHSSMPRRAAAWCIPKKQIFGIIFQFIIQKHMLDDKPCCCSMHRHAMRPMFCTLGKHKLQIIQSHICLLDTSHSALFTCCVFILSGASMICGRRQGVLPRAAYHKTRTLHIIFELFIYD